MILNSAAQHPSLRVANASDLPAVVALVNRAYQVERFIFDKDRTTLAEIEEMSCKGKFLVLESPDHDLLGSVYVEQRDARAYLGMLAIRPDLQGKGLGGKLIAAVEEHARSLGCTDLDLRVVSPRTELPGYYRQFGFVETHTAPAHVDVPSKIPWHLIYMSKPL
jgi:N-acetylglutamate synthase-like GNAT family acetyltransferase